MVFAKKITKAPAVMVETKKMSGDACCAGNNVCKKFKHVVVFVLVILNTLMLARVLCNQMNIEADRVGGRANYKMVQQIYKSEAFKAQQKQQIEQALQMYQQGAQQGVQATQQMPTTTVTQ